MKMMIVTLATFAVGATPALAAGDPVAGKDLFKAKCSVCHTAEQGGKNGVGPALWGVYGTKAGAVPGYVFSAAVVGSGVVWNQANLDKWLLGPMQMIPGTKMALAPISAPKERADITAFLATAKPKK